MTQLLKVALIGCGAIGACHSRALAAVTGARLVSVFDPDGSRARALAKADGHNARLASSVEDAAGGADAAIVATPNSLHGAQVRDLLLQGLHVLCEKPMATSAAEARDLVALSEERQRVLACGLVRRFYPAFELLSEALRAGILGEPDHCAVGESGYGWPFARWQFDRATPGSGILFDTGPHVFDVLLSMFDQLEVLDYREDAEEGVAAEAWLKLRAVAPTRPVHIDVHMGRSFPIHTGWRIEGSRGAATLDLQQIDRIELALGPKSRRFRSVSKRPLIDPFRLQLENFLEAVRGRAELRAPASAMIRGLEILEIAAAMRRRSPEPWTSPLPGPRHAPSGKILVTGAAGRIGSRMIELWHAGGRLKELRGVVRRYHHAARIMRFDIEIVEADLRDRRAVEKALAGCTEVVHFASGDCAGEETRTIAELALSKGVRRFVHLSSASIYGHSLPASIEDAQEDSQWSRTGDAYPDGKAAAERAVRDAARRGLPALILRPHIVYGPGMHWSEAPLHLLLTSHLCVLEDEGYANLIYVDDLIAAVERSLASTLRAAEAIFVTDGVPLRWSAYIDAHAALIGRSPAPRVRSADVLSLPARGLGSWLKASARPLGPLVHSREFRDLVMRSPLLRSTVYRALVAARNLPGLRGPLNRLRGENPPPSEPLCNEHWARLQLSAARLSNQRLRETLGFTPAVDFAEGLKRTRPWFEQFGLIPKLPLA
jgi:predicted dehydrogenase/nucleoside-diphosphate-sugar epimerase